MNTLLTLAHANLTDTNAAYNEATRIARAATMEGNGTVLRDYYTFEEYIARRGNFIHRLPEYKHLHNACWVVRKDTADLIFDDEEQQLTVREVRRRELAREIEPLLPLPTTANTESIDGFRFCRPEGWGEWSGDEVGDGEERGEGEGDVQTSGESEAFHTPATSPVEGGLVVGNTSPGSIALPEAATSIADHAELVEPLRQTATTPVCSVGYDGLDMTHPTHTDHSTSVPSITVTDDGQRAAARKETNVEAISRLKLSVDYSLEAPTASVDQTGLNTFHNDTTISDPKIRTGVEAIDRLRLSIDYSLRAPTERGNQAAPNTAYDNTTISDPKMPAGGEAQATPAASLPEPSTTPAKSPKLDWIALSKGQPQAEIATMPPVEALKPSPAKVKTFTPDPRVSSMAHYGIVAPTKKKEDTKHTEQSALKPATSVATTAASTVPITAAPKPAHVPETSTTTAPNVPVEIAPKPAALPETSIEAVMPAQKSDIQQQSAEPAAKRQKGIRGVAHPVKTPAARIKTPLTKNTPTPASTTDSPSTAPTKLGRRLASIIAGASLPKTKAEARAAATEHHARLLALHNSQPPTQTDPNRRTSTRLLPKPTNPDLMPFFFSRPPPDATTAATNKQGAAAAEQEDFIRCVCGVQHDDGEPMICCETCEVWQHSACVVPGLAEGKLEALRWECTVCNPWGNREVLRNLRAGVVQAKEKEVKGGKWRASAAP